jgi:hypothetical protein
VLAPLNMVLEHGYFFDDFYEKVVAKGFIGISKGLRYVEVAGLGRLPYLFANGIAGISRDLRHVEVTGFGRLPYFFAHGIIRISNGVHEYVEKAMFDRLPQSTAIAVMSFAHSTHKYFDVFVDELLYITANRTLSSASKIKKTYRGSLQHYVAAALLGFLILLILIIVTMLR